MCYIDSEMYAKAVFLLSVFLLSVFQGDGFGGGGLVCLYQVWYCLLSDNTLLPLWRVLTLSTALMYLHCYEFDFNIFISNLTFRITCSLCFVYLEISAKPWTVWSFHVFQRREGREGKNQHNTLNRYCHYCHYHWWLFIYQDDLTLNLWQVLLYIQHGQSYAIQAQI